jgi:large subunit ribosomal protein L21
VRLGAPSSCPPEPSRRRSGCDRDRAPPIEETIVYAVIATGGKQYRVKVGDTLDVEKLAPSDGGLLELRPLLVVGDDGAVTSGPDALANVTVRASVVEQVKGPKLTVFKYKNKTGYRNRNGHRQPLTRIRVDEITA